MSSRSFLRRWCRWFLVVSVIMVACFVAAFLVIGVLTLPYQLYSIVEQGAVVTHASDARGMPEWLLYANGTWLFVLTVALWATLFALDEVVEE